MHEHVVRSHVSASDEHKLSSTTTHILQHLVITMAHQEWSIAPKIEHSLFTCTTLHRLLGLREIPYMIKKIGKAASA